LPSRAIARCLGASGVGVAVTVGRPVGVLPGAGVVAALVGVAVGVGSGVVATVALADEAASGGVDSGRMGSTAGPQAAQPQETRPASKAAWNHRLVGSIRTSSLIRSLPQAATGRANERDPLAH